jgi:hypothetical protein
MTTYNKGVITNPTNPLKIETSSGVSGNLDCADIQLHNNSILGITKLQFGSGSSSGQIDNNETNGGQFTITSDDNIYMHFNNGGDNIRFFEGANIQANGLYSNALYLANNNTISSGNILGSQNVTRFNNPIYAVGGIAINSNISTNDYFSSNDNGRIAYLNNDGRTAAYGVSNSQWDPDATFSIFAKYRIACGQELNVSSDIRIKKKLRLFH